MKNLKSDFKKFKKDLFKKETLILFLIVLVPQILRQILYFITQNKTGVIDFIASYETVQIYTTGFPIVGITEEILIGLLFISLWVFNDNTKFFTYGWLFDASFDFLSVLFWFLLGATPLQMLGLSHPMRFMIREILFSYVIFGPLLWKYKLDIKKVAYSATGFGLFTILLILAA